MPEPNENYIGTFAATCDRRVGVINIRRLASVPTLADASARNRPGDARLKQLI